TGRSRGFGFVEMSEGAEEAISNLNGAQFQGRALTVNEAKPREERPRTGGGDRGSRGGFGGGRRWEAPGRAKPSGSNRLKTGKALAARPARALFDLSFRETINRPLVAFRFRPD